MSELGDTVELGDLLVFGQDESHGPVVNSLLQVVTFALEGFGTIQCRCSEVSTGKPGDIYDDGGYARIDQEIVWYGVRVPISEYVRL